MLTKRCLLTAAALLVGGAVNDLAAQGPPAGGLDLSMAMITSSGGDYRDREATSYLLEIYFNALERPAPSTLLMGLQAGYHDFEGRNGCEGPVTTECLRRPFPDMLVVGAMAAWQQAITTSTLVQGGAGVSMYRPSTGGPAVGVEGRVVVAQYIISRIAIQASGRVAAVPFFRGDQVVLSGWSVGLRLR